MSYFSFQGGNINQAAAGLGRLPPQAAAGFGVLPPQAAAGLMGLGDDMPLPVVRSFRDGVFGNRYAPKTPNTHLLQAFRDGIFGLGAEAPTYDMSDAEALKQFKLVLQYVMSTPEGQALTPAAIDTAAYGAETEAVYQAWAAQQPDAASMMQSVNGHVIPTTTGLFYLFAAGIKASESAGGSYAATYWPIPFAYHQAILATGPGAAMVPPKFDGTGREGSLKASTLLMGGLAAALVVGGIAVMRKKRRSYTPNRRRRVTRRRRRR